MNKNSVFLHSDNCATTDESKFCTHRSFYWSSVKSLSANYFFIHSDNFNLLFFNIHKCQLTISWVTMATCGPIVFPKVLWMQHLQIIFNINALDRMQIIKSMLKVKNWYKNEIVHYFHKWYIPYLLPERKCEYNRNSHAVWNHTVPLTRYGQNHHQSAININTLWTVMKVLSWSMCIV